MSFTLSEIAAALGLNAVGAAELRLTGLAEPQEAGPEHLALAMDRKYADALGRGQARAALLWPGADWQALGLEGAIFVERAGAVLPRLTALMDKGPMLGEGIHPEAVIDPGAEIGPGATIGAFAVIGPGVRIGPGARIAPHVSIAAGARIGADALLHAGVRIEREVVIGDRFIAQPNAVIGGDGFSFKVVEEASAVEKLRAGVSGGAEQPATVAGSRRWARVASLGTVIIGDDVEVGAATTIDRGTIRATRIGDRCKLDNHIQIGHNVVLGSDCLLAAGTGIGGSSRLGDRVVLGGYCGVSDNVFIGDDVVAGGRTAVFSNVPGGRAIWGNPAVRLETQIAINKELRRLPRLAARLRALEAKLPPEGEPNVDK